MYTIDYLKTLHADYVEWNTDPGNLSASKTHLASWFASMMMSFGDR
jgi:hypothetical protein